MIKPVKPLGEILHFELTEQPVHGRQSKLNLSRGRRELRRCLQNRQTIERLRIEEVDDLDGSIYSGSDWTIIPSLHPLGEQFRQHVIVAVAFGRGGPNVCFSKQDLKGRVSEG